MFDVFVARNVVGSESAKTENGRGVVAARHRWDLLDDHQKTWRQRLSSLEICEVQHNPHVIVRACTRVNTNACTRVQQLRLPLKCRANTSVHCEAVAAKRQARKDRIQQGRLFGDTQSYSLELNTGFVVSMEAKCSVV